MSLAVKRPGLELEYSHLVSRLRMLGTLPVSLLGVGLNEPHKYPPWGSFCWKDNIRSTSLVPHTKYNPQITCRPFKTRTPRSLPASGFDCPLTQRRIPEEQNPFSSPNSQEFTTGSYSSESNSLPLVPFLK